MCRGGPQLLHQGPPQFPAADQDCGPGLARSTTTACCSRSRSPAETMPLCCENISAPRLPRPTTPEGVDALARRAHEFLDLVIRGIQTQS